MSASQELVARLQATADQLCRMADSAQFVHDGYVRVKSPEFLLKDLNDAVEALSSAPSPEISREPIARIVKAIRGWQANKLTTYTPTDLLYDHADDIVAALSPVPPSNEATARIPDGNATDLRDAFEEWAQADNRNIQPLEFEERTPDNNHYYEHDTDNQAYIGWCAALASLSSPVSVPAVVRQMAEFVSWALQEGPWEGGDLDGGGVQDKAESLGLIVKEPYDPTVHGESDCSEVGDDWFVFAPELRAALSTPATGQGEAK